MTPRIIPVPLTLALALALASPASAQAISSIEACGASGCTDITSAGHDWSAFNFGSTTTTPPQTRLLPRSRSAIGGHDHWSFLFAPAASKVRLPDEPGTFRWLQVTDATDQRLQRLIGGVKPFPADRLAGDRRRERPARPGRRDLRARTAQNASADAGGGFDAWPFAAGALVIAIALGCVGLARRGRRRRTAGSAA